MRNLFLLLHSSNVSWVKLCVAGMLCKVWPKPSLLMGKSHRPSQIRGKDIEIRKRTILRPRVGEESCIPVVREDDELTANLPQIFDAGLLTLQSWVSAAAKDVPHECFGVHALPISGKHFEPLLNKAGHLIFGELSKAAHGEWRVELGERFGSGDGEHKTLPTRQIAFEPLPASVLFGLGGFLVVAHVSCFLLFERMVVEIKSANAMPRLMEKAIVPFWSAPHSAGSGCGCQT
jgi:hypothetical protein